MSGKEAPPPLYGHWPLRIRVRALSCVPLASEGSEAGVPSQPHSAQAAGRAGSCSPATPAPARAPSRFLALCSRLLSFGPALQGAGGLSPASRRAGQCLSCAGSDTGEEPKQGENCGSDCLGTGVGLLP